MLSVASLGNVNTIATRAEKIRSFRDNIRKKFFLRFHMFLILSATAFAGLLASKLLLMVHLNSMLVRYPIAVIISYLAFLFFLKLWLYYVSDERSRADSGRSSLLDGGDGVADVFGGGASPGRSVTTGGGGSFGGGGAAGSFEEGPGAPMENAMEICSSSQQSGGSAGGLGAAVSDAADAVGDDAGKFIIVLILLIVVLTAIFGAGIYLIVQAPAILSEAAFQFWLAASLRKRTREMAAPDWTGSVLRMTWKPFALVLIITFAFGFAVHHFYPGAVKITDVVTWRRVTGVK